MSPVTDMNTNNDMAVDIIEWAGMVTHKVNQITDVLVALSDLHQEINYLGLPYCGRCMIEWPCPEAQVFALLEVE